MKLDQCEIELTRGRDPLGCQVAGKEEIFLLTGNRDWRGKDVEV